MDNLMPVLLLVLAAVGLISLLSFRYVNQRRLRSRQREGLNLIQALQRMLSHVQRHRGLNYGVMKGAIELDCQILDLKHFISEDIHRIEHSNQWLSTTDSWGTITKTWAKLTNPHGTWICEANFSKHNELVELILDCIDLSVTEYQLIQLQTFDTDRSYGYLWQELLPTAELLGQVRALGTGIAAAGYHSDEDRVRLHELVRAIEVNMDCLWMNILNNQQLERDIDLFLSSVDDSIIVRKPSIMPHEYFNLGTAAIDGLYNHYQLEINHLTDHIFRESPIHPIFNSP
ncbi:hypothetical protein NBRC116591_15380 [Sessilibacter corallicola]|uniref:Uncharacterized protein n=2 Tax=Sessilibacter corallicola TaxID=2904075 RepID=A0ABQ0A7V1_9GAMM